MGGINAVHCQTRAADRCVRLLHRSDVPEHVRALNSPQVLEVLEVLQVEATINVRTRDAQPTRPAGSAWVVAA